MHLDLVFKFKEFRKNIEFEDSLELDLNCLDLTSNTP